MLSRLIRSARSLRASVNPIKGLPVKKNRGVICRRAVDPVLETLEVRQMLTSFAYTGSIQTYTVPSTGVYAITAAGGGGGSGGALGGLGAVLSGEVALIAGTKLQIVVGGQSNGFGGAGGTFVFVSGASEPLEAAGGGGGGEAANVQTNAQLSTTGGSTGVAQNAMDGNGGYGGQLAASIKANGSAGGGGAGWLKGGQYGASSGSPKYPGGNGGDGPPSFAGGTSSFSVEAGSFGGGGSAGDDGVNVSCGGGGGYTGGDGADDSNNPSTTVYNAGGGGSYIDPSLTNTTGVVNRTGNGAVTIGGVLTVNPQSFTVGYERSTTLLLTATEPNATLKYGIVSSPQSGKLSNLNPQTGTVTYTPLTGFSGTDSFMFNVSDGTTAISSTVTVTVGASPNAAWMSSLSDQLPLAQISLPGTYQSESSAGTDEVPGLDASLQGVGAANVTSSGSEAEANEALHITSSLTATAISAEAAVDMDNPALDAAGITADAAATASDSQEGADGSSTGLGLVLSLASDGFGEAADLATIVEKANSVLTSSDDTAAEAQTAMEETDSTTDAADHTAADTDDMAAAGVDGTVGTENGAAATDDGLAESLNGTAGGGDTAAEVTDGPADVADVAAEAEGGVDPVADGVAAVADAVAAVDDSAAAAEDTAADVSDVAADAADGTAVTGDGAATATDTMAEAAGGNAGAEDSAAATLESVVNTKLTAAASDHTTSAVNDAAGAAAFVTSAASDGYTASTFTAYLSGQGNPDTTGGNSLNSSLQTALYTDAKAEAGTHSTSAGLETAAAAADTVATGLDTAASVADAAAITAVKAEVTANAAAVAANSMAVAAEQKAETDDATAAGDEGTAAGENGTAIGDNSAADGLDAAAAVADGVDAGANTAAAAADITAIALDATALATVEIPIADAVTAIAAAAGEVTSGILDGVSDGADTAAEVTDSAAIGPDGTAAGVDGLAVTGDTNAATAATTAATDDAAAVTAEETAAALDAKAAEAASAALSACMAADEANASADTADSAASKANLAACAASGAASAADATFTAEATIIQNIDIGAQTQTLPVADQLNAGVRSLDLQAQQVNDTININSGKYFSGATLQNALNDATSFLQSNPSETIVITLGNETPAANSQHSFYADLNTLLNSSDTAVPGVTYDSFIYSSSNASQVPSLGAVRGKIVFVPAADNTWVPSTDPTTHLPIGWQPAKQVTQDSHADTDPNTRWNDANTGGTSGTSGLIATDTGDATTLYRNNLSQDNTFTSSIGEPSAANPNMAVLSVSGLSPVASGDEVDAIAEDYFGSVQVSRTTGIVGINDPDQNLITELIDQNALPFVVTSDSDDPAASGTLRDAILEANAQPGLNSIEFASQLTGTTGNTIFLESNLPAITNNLIVSGPVNVVLNGYQGFSPSSSPGIQGSGSTHSVTDTILPASDNGTGTPTTVTDSTAPLYVDTSGITVTSVAGPVVDPISITYGTLLANSQLIGSEYSDTNGTLTNVPGTFKFTTANGSLPHGGNNQPEAVTFTPTNLSLNPSSTSVILNVAKVVPQLPSLSSISLNYGTVLANSQLAVLAKPSGISGTYVYTNTAGSLLHYSATAQVEPVTFIPTDTVDYTSVFSTVKVNVAKVTPLVTTLNTVNLVYGTPLDNTQLVGTASSTVGGLPTNVSGSFTYNSTNGKILSGGSNQSALVTFTPSDTVDYITTSVYALINVTAQNTPTIVGVNPVNITYGTVLNNSQLSGTATFVLNGATLNLPGTFSYNGSTGTLLHAGQGQPESVTFTPTDTTDYTTATSTVTVNVARAVATIQDPVNITYGTPLANNQLQGTATFLVGGQTVTIPGTFAYASVGAVLPAGNAQVQPIVFTPNDITDYAPANSSVTVNVAQGTPTLSYSVQNGSNSNVSTMTGVAPLNIQYSTALTNNVPATSTLYSNNQLNASATYNVGGNIVTVPGLLSYTTAAGIVLNPISGQVEHVTFTPTDTTDYANVQSSVTVTVTPLVPQVTLVDGTLVANQSAGTTANLSTGVTLQSYTSVYTGSSQPATGNVLDANGNSIGTPVISYYLASDKKLSNPLPAAPTNVGNYLVVGTFAAPNTNYNASGDTVNFSITALPTTTTVIDPGGTYSGSPFPATSSSVTGGGGLHTNASSFSYVGTGSTVYPATTMAPVNAGTYTVTAAYSGDATHAVSTSNAVPFTIVKASSSTAVTDLSGAYTGKPFNASGTVTGAGGLNTSASSYSYGGTGSTTYGSSTAPTTPGSYTVTASYAGDVNHTGSSSTPVPFSIGVASSTTSVVLAGGTYTGAPLPATVTVTGPGGLNASASSISYIGVGSTVYAASPTAPTVAGTYTVTAAYNGDVYHTGSTSGAVAFSINKAASTTSVTDAGGTYNGKSFAATAQSATGVGGLSDTSVGDFTFSYAGTGSTSYTASSSAPINAGTYSVTATYNGDANHNSSSSVATPFTIAKATLTATATAAGKTYDGTTAEPTAPTITLAGIVAADAGPQFQDPSFEQVASTDVFDPASANWTFTSRSAVEAIGGQAFNVTSAADGSQVAVLQGYANTVGAISQTINVTPGGSYTVSFYAAQRSAHWALPVTVSVDGTVVATVTPTSLSFLKYVTPTFTLTPGSHTFTFSGTQVNNDYDAFIDAVSLNAVGFSDATVTASGAAAFASAAAGSETVNVTGITLSGAAASNYTLANTSTTTTATIAKATPSVSLIANGGVYNTAPIGATATVNGVTGPAGPTLESVAPTLTYYTGSTATGTGSPTAPTAAGTYTVVATFAGSGDYTTASASKTFTITQAGSVLQPIATTVAYGGTASLSTTLTTAGGAVLAGRTVTFSLNGKVVGTALTNSSGVATLAASVAGTTPGVYSSGYAVSFAGDSNSTAISAATSLIVNDAPIVATGLNLLPLTTLQTLGTFTQARSGASAGDFTITINWGDGSAPVTATACADLLHPGQFDIVGPLHFYTGIFVTYKITVTISTVGKFGAAGTTTSFVDTILA